MPLFIAEKRSDSDDNKDSSKKLINRHSEVAKEIDELDKKKKTKKKNKEKTLMKKTEKAKKEPKVLFKVKKVDKEDREKEKQNKIEAKKKADEEKKKAKLLEKQKKQEAKEKAARDKKKAKLLEKQKKLEAKKKAAEEKKKKKEEKKSKPEKKTVEKKKEKPKKEKPKKEEKPKKKLFAKKEIDDPEFRVLAEEVVDSEITETVKDNVYIRSGFGYKGLGSRKIYYDSKINEYRYDVFEPELSSEEEKIKDQITYFFRIRADTDVFDTAEMDKKKYLKMSLEQIVREKHMKLDQETKDKIFYYIFREFIGYGKIDILMKDEGIEDISCDGIEIPIFLFHKEFESIRTNIRFKDSDELDSFVVKLSQLCGKQISVYEPVVDGKLEDGSRLQTTLSRTITKYSTFTIRKFREDPMTPIDLIENNTMSLDMAAYFWLVIEKGTSILFCGGTASGKTTALNALSLFLPATFKIVSIEDTREINLPHENWIAGTTRTGFAATEDFKTGKDIDMFDLIKVALRQRPRVIIVGEVRGKEAYTLFQAMTTGHLSYSTVHASDMHSLIQRLENKPIDLPRALLTSLDLIVFLNAVTVKGCHVRRITNVTEVIKLDPESNRLVTITPYRWLSEINDKFESTGGSRIFHHLKLQYGWNDDQLQQEFQNRKDILTWMMKNDLKGYEDVGRIVSEYSKDPEKILKKVREDK